jgi:hypothetical protein
LQLSCKEVDSAIVRAVGERMGDNRVPLRQIAEESVQPRLE